ncbi:hypothetical protein B0O80DRAFT_502987 [Mortierella sp. GBAus27b]|nr:hypothetical protein B0O80DRAFT_502987 [Mortierella sp. GBAus27b]
MDTLLEHFVCSCKDFTRNHMWCKHICAVMMCQHSQGRQNAPGSSIIDLTVDKVAVVKPEMDPAEEDVSMINSERGLAKDSVTMVKAEGDLAENGAAIVKPEGDLAGSRAASTTTVVHHSGMHDDSAPVCCTDEDEEDLLDYNLCEEGLERRVDRLREAIYVIRHNERRLQDMEFAVTCIRHGYEMDAKTRMAMMGVEYPERSKV